MTRQGRNRSKAQETRLAAAVDGVKVPFSGAGKVKGDVHSATVFYECKTSARKSSTGVKSISIRKDDLQKMLVQQQKEAKPLHALHIHFAGDRQDWVICSFDQWLSLVNEGGISET